MCPFSCQARGFEVVGVQAAELSLDVGELRSTGAVSAMMAIAAISTAPGNRHRDAAVLSAAEAPRT